MSFEAFPADAVQQFNDPGPYYVRENGRLRSPPGLGPSAHFPHRPTNTVPSANSVNGSDKTPRKLYDMTLDFVAANITLVESLVGFPEIVGQQLFDASHRHGNLSHQALRLFSDAYGDTILRSVNLHGHHLAVNQQLGCLAIFPCLTELEVGGCCLGDDHEILPIITNCYSLTRLGLASNGLTDVGIQRLTAPLRVWGRGLKNLSILDLAGNPGIGDKSARQYLTVYTSLKAIDLSGCSTSSVGLDVLKTKLRLVSSILSTTSPFESTVETVGWASPLVGQWIDSSTHLMQRAKCKASKDQASKANHFYGRARKRLENVSRSTLRRPRASIFPTIQLVAVATYHSQLGSHPDEVKRSEVTASTVDRFAKDGKKPSPCRQEIESNRSKHVELSQTESYEELMGRYTLHAKEISHENKRRGTQQDWNIFGTDESTDKGNQMTIGQEPVRTGKPPARKKIKLCARADKGFPDILHDQEIDDGIRHADSKLDRESATGQQDSDWRRSGDENRTILKGHRSRLNQRQPVQHGRNKRQPRCNCRLGSVQNGNNRDECTCSDQASNKDTRNTLWSAMHTEEWG